MLNKGIYAAALTPMDRHYQCNVKQLTDHCIDLLKRGCQGVVLFGTTGEGASFSTPEKIEILNEVIGAGLDPKKIIVANGSASFPDTIALAKAAHSCAATLICPPSFYKNVTDEGVIDYYRVILRSVPQIKMLLYHIPQYSGVPISIRTIRALREEFPKNVFGLKESEGNQPLVKEVVKSFPGFQVFVGKESQIIEAVHAGGAGSICGLANLFPELIVSLYGHSGPNPKELEEIVNQFRKNSFIPAAKAWLEKKTGESWKVVRPPLTEAS
ncbi:MAG: dihydrodipicolinate synthase family protein [Parachlamydiales bacterium]|nr:dihydrodipicolinate synthase family protein [Parachlamydiales bacterium]